MKSWVEPLVVSWGYESQYPSASRFIDEQEWTGTKDYAAFLAVPEAIKFFAEHNWDAVRAECHAIAQYAREKIADVVGAKHASPLPCPDSPEWYSQMFAVPLPSSVEVQPGKPALLQKRLFEEFKIEVPVVNWQGKPLLRVSIQAYNSRVDVDWLVEALGKLLGRG
jgi:isopenicillin-N epimerase